MQPHEGAKRVRRRKHKTTPMFRQNNGVQMAKQRRCFTGDPLFIVFTYDIKKGYPLASRIRVATTQTQNKTRQNYLFTRLTSEEDNPEMLRYALCFHKLARSHLVTV